MAVILEQVENPIKAGGGDKNRAAPVLDESVCNLAWVWRTGCPRLYAPVMGLEIGPRGVGRRRRMQPRFHRLNVAVKISLGLWI